MDRKREKDGGEQHRPRQRRPEVSLTKFPSTVSAESPRGGNANGIARRGRQRIMDIGGGAFGMRMHRERERRKSRGENGFHFDGWYLQNLSPGFTRLLL